MACMMTGIAIVSRDSAEEALQIAERAPVVLSGVERAHQLLGSVARRRHVHERADERGRDAGQGLLGRTAGFADVTRGRLYHVRSEITLHQVHQVDRHDPYLLAATSRSKHDARLNERSASRGFPHAAPSYLLPLPSHDSVCGAHAPLMRHSLT